MNTLRIFAKYRFLPLLPLVAVCSTMPMATERFAGLPPLPVLAPEYIAELMPDFKPALAAATTESVHLQALAHFQDCELPNISQSLLDKPIDSALLTPTVQKLEKLFMGKIKDPENRQERAHALRTYLGHLKHLSSILKTQHDYMNAQLGAIVVLAIDDVNDALSNAIITGTKKDGALYSAFADFSEYYATARDWGNVTIIPHASIARDSALKVISGNQCELNEFEQEAPTPEAGEFLFTSAQHMQMLYKALEKRYGTTSDDVHRICMSYALCLPYYQALYCASRLATTAAVREGANLDKNRANLFLNYLYEHKGKPFPATFAPLLTAPARSLLYNYQPVYKKHAPAITHAAATYAKQLAELDSSDELFVDFEKLTLSPKSSPKTADAPRKKKKKSRKKRKPPVEQSELHVALSQSESPTSVRTPQTEYKVVAADGSYFIRVGSVDTPIIHDLNNDITITLHPKLKPGNEPTATKFAYSAAIKKWFAAPYDALNEKITENPHEDYTDNDRAIMVHTFAKSVDHFITTHATEFVTRTHPDDQNFEYALIMPATITYNATGAQETGYFAYLINESGTCFHRMFDVRKNSSALAQELKKQRCFDYYKK